MIVAGSEDIGPVIRPKTNVDVADIVIHNKWAN